MSHAQIDHLADLQRRIADLDQEIAAAKADDSVVDLHSFGEMKRRRATLIDEALKAEALAR